jgi:hypothetical protein
VLDAAAINAVTAIMKRATAKENAATVLTRKAIPLVAACYAHSMTAARAIVAGSGARPAAVWDARPLPISHLTQDQRSRTGRTSRSAKPHGLKSMD